MTQTQILVTIEKTATLIGKKHFINLVFIILNSVTAKRRAGANKRVPMTEEMVGLEMEENMHGTRCAGTYNPYAFVACSISKFVQHFFCIRAHSS